MTGNIGSDVDGIIDSPKLSVALEALARSYDYVMIDAGALSDGATVRLAQLAVRAVLVAGGLSAKATLDVRDQLLAAGYAHVSVLVGMPILSDSAAEVRAAA